MSQVHSWFIWRRKKRLERRPYGGGALGAQREEALGQQLEPEDAVAVGEHQLARAQRIVGRRQVRVQPHCRLATRTNARVPFFGKKTTTNKSKTTCPPSVERAGYNQSLTLMMLTMWPKNGCQQSWWGNIRCHWKTMESKVVGSGRRRVRHSPVFDDDDLRAGRRTAVAFGVHQMRRRRPAQVDRRFAFHAAGGRSRTHLKKKKRKEKKTIKTKKNKPKKMKIERTCVGGAERGVSCGGGEGGVGGGAFSSLIGWRGSDVIGSGAAAAVAFLATPDGSRFAWTPCKRAQSTTQSNDISFFFQNNRTRIQYKTWLTKRGSNGRRNQEEIDFVGTSWSCVWKKRTDRKFEWRHSGRRLAVLGRRHQLEGGDGGRALVVARRDDLQRRQRRQRRDASLAGLEDRARRRDAFGRRLRWHRRRRSFEVALPKIIKVIFTLNGHKKLSD